MRSFRLGRVGVALAVLVSTGLSTVALAACSAKGGIDGFGDGGPVGPGTDGGLLVTETGPLDATAATEVRMYAHTNTKLYAVDSKDLSQVTDLGTFLCLNPAGTKSMTDIAVDKAGKLYGVAQDAVFLDMKIGPAGVDCGKRVDLTNPSGKIFGASMAPVGSLYPDREALLIADSSGDIYDVDTTTGAIRGVGNFGNVPNAAPYLTTTRGKPWALSGDIVFLANNGSPIAFATVRDCPTSGACNTVDTLIQIDPKKLTGPNSNVTISVRGQIKKASNCNDPGNDSYGSIYGVAAFDDNIIGFGRASSGGAQSAFIVKINNRNGQACGIADVGAQVGGGWAGAGVTTVVNVVAPPN
jgi:hypothetical protein